MKRVALGLLLVLLGGYLLTGVVEVRPGERAVIRRFGEVLKDKPGPGLHVGWPWGIDRVERLKVDDVRRIEVGFTGRDADEATATPTGQLLIGDHNLVNVQVIITYSIDNDQVEKYFLHSDRAELLIASTAETVLAEWVAGRNVDHVLLDGKKLLKGVLDRKSVV